MPFQQLIITQQQQKNGKISRVYSLLLFLGLVWLVRTTTKLRNMFQQLHTREKKKKKKMKRKLFIFNEREKRIQR